MECDKNRMAMKQNYHSTGIPIHLRSVSILGGVLLGISLSVFAVSGNAAVKAFRGQESIPTYPWSPAVKHPYFRGTDKVNIYPYPMLDNLSREKTNRTYRTVVLENECLRITILPELGGKIQEVLDKTTGKPMFYVNHVIKPGLIGQCGAWTSGGVEWNTGPQGHTVGAMQPVDVEILPLASDGSRSVAIGETEGIYGLKWTVILTLRPGRSFIEECIRIYNPTTTIRPYYFWNCTAMPNTPGFRFIYPMTLGTDHGSEKFFHWPVDHGKDLSRGTNYQDASSIFAWHCDQDFFGSYDDGEQRGVVAYANHDQVPGKKAWTWGQGGFGKMHQMDLTDTDGPYNEVQTGPLLTQGEVGRLDPSEAVTWREWWYPVHGIGGFTFANRDVAVNAAIEEGALNLRLLGTGSWPSVEVRVLKETAVSAHAQCALSPSKPANLKLDLAGMKEPVMVDIVADNKSLARFRVPLDLPLRLPPERKPGTDTAAELAVNGWQDFRFARFPEAEAKFLQTLEKDPKSVTARTGLAFLAMDRDPGVAVREAQAALATDPDCGLARLTLAVGELRTGDEKSALTDAWKASLDPSTAISGRTMVVKLLLRLKEWDRAAAAISEPGPWQTDPACRGLQAFALLQSNQQKRAVDLARTNLELDPLDAFSRSLLWLAKTEDKSMRLQNMLEGNAQNVLNLAIQFSEINQNSVALNVIEIFHTQSPAVKTGNPMLYYWAAYLSGLAGDKERVEKHLAAARRMSIEGIFPHHFESVPVLRWASDRTPLDGQASLLLGHLLFSLSRHEEGRALWRRAIELGAAPVVAYRALGMASLTIYKDPEGAIRNLAKAHEFDHSDAIVARDLARALLSREEESKSDETKHTLLMRVRETLKSAFTAGQGRSDFVALLARTQNRLGEYAETARMLDKVRVTIWEGASEAHDLFEAAHLALGQAHLEAGRAAEALAEFDRALEYPENLATGKLENSSQAHILYLRGNALAALGRSTESISSWKRAAAEPASKEDSKEQARKKSLEAIEKAGKP